MCENVDCAADFDRCADFDEAQCSGCDVSFEHLENVVLKDRVLPLSYPLGGVHSQIQNVREHLLDCLQRNELSDFMTISNSVTDEMLFTINI